MTSKKRLRGRLPSGDRNVFSSLILSVILPVNEVSKNKISLLVSAISAICVYKQLLVSCKQEVVRPGVCKDGRRENKVFEFNSVVDSAKWN